MKTMLVNEVHGIQALLGDVSSYWNKALTGQLKYQGRSVRADLTEYGVETPFSYRACPAGVYHLMTTGQVLKNLGATEMFIESVRQGYSQVFVDAVSHRNLETRAMLRELLPYVHVGQEYSEIDDNSPMLVKRFFEALIESIQLC
jgi:hypothetical protein